MEIDIAYKYSPVSFGPRKPFLLQESFLFNNKIKTVLFEDWINTLSSNIKKNPGLEFPTRRLIKPKLKPTTDTIKDNLLCMLYIHSLIKRDVRCQPGELNTFSCFPLGHCAIVGPLRKTNKLINLPNYGVLGSWFFPRFVFLLEYSSDKLNLEIRRFCMFRQTDILNHCLSPQKTITLNIDDCLDLSKDITKLWQSVHLFGIDFNLSENIIGTSPVYQLNESQLEQVYSEYHNEITTETLFHLGYTLDCIGISIECCKKYASDLLSYIKPIYQECINKRTGLFPSIIQDCIVDDLISVVNNFLFVENYKSYSRLLRVLFDAHNKLSVAENIDVDTRSNLITIINYTINKAVNDISSIHSDELGQAGLIYGDNPDDVCYLNGLVLDINTADYLKAFSKNVQENEFWEIDETFLRKKENDYLAQKSIVKTPKLSGIFQIAKNNVFGYGFNIGNQFKIIDNSKSIDDQKKYFSYKKIIERKSPSNGTQVFQTWTFSPKNSNYSIISYRTGSKVKCNDVRDKLKKLFNETTIIAPDEKEIFEILFTWIISTYCFELFEEHPIIIFQGDSDQNIRDIIAAITNLCFNGKRLTNPSEDSILKYATEYQATLSILDLDPENIFYSKGTLSFNLNRGNTKDWTETAKDATETFYCPKIIHAKQFLTHNIDTGPYGISFNLNHMPNRYLRTIESEEKQIIIDMICSFIMTNWQSIVENYRNLEYFSSKGINRIWKPLFAVAKVVGTEDCLLTYYINSIQNSKAILETDEIVQTMIILKKLINDYGKGHFFHDYIVTQYHKYFDKEFPNRNRIRSILRGIGYPKIVNKRNKGIRFDPKLHRDKVNLRPRDNSYTAYFLDPVALDECILEQAKNPIYGKCNIITLINEQVNQND